VIAAYFGDGFTREVPDQFALMGKNAREQLVALAGMLTAGASDVVNEIAANHQAVFLNFFYWEQLDLAVEGISIEERDRVLELIRRSWARSRRHDLPLGVVAR
jgi:hypothetical protein